MRYLVIKYEDDCGHCGQTLLILVRGEFPLTEICVCMRNKQGQFCKTNYFTVSSKLVWEGGRQ